MNKYILLAVISILFLTGIGVYQYVYFNDGRLHVVFCDVGQGDGIVIRTPGQKIVVVDGGPDKKIIDCLSGHMPFWERTIDLILLTHPHQDHFFGLNYVLDRFITLYFDTEDIVNTSSNYVELHRKLSKKSLVQRKIYAGDMYRLGQDLSLTIEAPSKEYLQRASPNGEIGETGELASLVIKLSYKDFDLLLTGDAQTPVLEDVAQGNKDSIEVLQVPHHGSATGLSKDVLDKISPRLAVISVGKGNTYGLPKSQVLTYLKDEGVKVLRTDWVGDIEIVSDGKKWWIK